jgi:hypothetical protein
MASIEWRAPSGSIAVDVATVPSPDDVEDIVDYVAGLPFGSARYAALLATIGMAGMRPSEAIGLRVVDLELPSAGWGTAAARGAITSPGTRYTADGTTVEIKGLKQRPTDAVREVPLPPALVAHLRRHLDALEPVNGRIFANALGRPITSSNYGPIWVRARDRLWPAGHTLSKATVYDLRHSAATMMLRAGVPAAEVARGSGLGHGSSPVVSVLSLHPPSKRVSATMRQRSAQVAGEAAPTPLGCCSSAEESRMATGPVRTPTDRCSSPQLLRSGHERAARWQNRCRHRSEPRHGR